MLRNGQVVDDARMWHIEQQLADISQRVESFNAEAHGDSGWDAKLVEHEVRMNSFRAKLDAVEEHFRNLDDHIRSDLDSRYQTLHKSIKETVTRGFEDRVALQGDLGIGDLVPEIGSEAEAYQYLQQTVPGAMEYHSPSQVQSPPTSEPCFGLDDAGVLPPSDALRVEAGQHLPQVSDELLQVSGSRLSSRQGSRRASKEPPASAGGSANLQVPHLGSGQLRMSTLQSQLQQQQFGGEEEHEGLPHHEVGIVEDTGMADMISSRLATLIQQLQEVVPKVMEHESILSQLPMTTGTEEAARQAAVDASRALQAINDVAADAKDALQAAKEAKDAASHAQSVANDASDRVAHSQALTSSLSDEVDDVKRNQQQQLALGLSNDPQARQFIDEAVRAQQQSMGIVAQSVSPNVAVTQLVERVAQAEALGSRGAKAAEAVSSLQQQVADLSQEVARASQLAQQQLQQATPSPAWRPEGQVAMPEDISALELQVQQVQQVALSQQQAQQSTVAELRKMAGELQDLQQRVALSEDVQGRGPGVEDIRQRLTSIERHILYIQPSPAGPAAGAPAMLPGFQPEAIRGAVSPVPSTPVMVNGEGNPEEIECLVHKVAEAETECTRIQQQLQDRISSMDKMLENMASNIFRPMSDGLNPTQALTDLGYSPGTTAAGGTNSFLPSAASPSPVASQAQGQQVGGTIFEPVTPQAAGSGRPPVVQDGRGQTRVATPRGEDATSRTFSPRM